jgi:teichuronic acid exporter
MSKLKDKTITGIFWSFIDNFANLGISFIVGIVLARILNPREFGLVGMLTIFISISSFFIDSGFGQALIRKMSPSKTDYSTVFYFNLVVSIVLYLILFLCAGSIAAFFKEPQLKLLVQVLGISLIINSFSIIQRTILTKRLDFKLQTKISFISSVISGIAGIGMAVAGYGVWSLVIKTIVMYASTSLLFWLWNRWKPLFVFSIKSFIELFSFGYKILIGGLIDIIYQNLNYLIIGKFYSSTELGYYTRADQFQALPSSNLANVIQRVTYPVLSKVQDNDEKLKSMYKKIVKNTMFITICTMFSLSAVSKTFILLLIGEKWINSIPYLQLLSIIAIFYPISAINLNILNVKGRSDMFLKYVIIVRILSIPPLFVGIFIGIKEMIICMLFLSILAYNINIHYVSKLMKYNVKEQFFDILPSLLIGLFLLCALNTFEYFVEINLLLKFLTEIILTISAIVVISRIFKISEYNDIKEIILTYIFKIFKK